MLREGQLVIYTKEWLEKNKSSGLTQKTSIVLKTTYCTVVTEEPEPFGNNVIASSEVLVVDLLTEGVIYKKIPISILRKVR